MIDQILSFVFWRFSSITNICQQGRIRPNIWVHLLCCAFLDGNACLWNPLMNSINASLLMPSYNLFHGESCPTFISGKITSLHNQTSHHCLSLTSSRPSSSVVFCNMCSLSQQNLYLRGIRQQQICGETLLLHSYYYYYMWGGSPLIYSLFISVDGVYFLLIKIVQTVWLLKPLNTGNDY